MQILKNELGSSIIEIKEIAKRTEYILNAVFECVGNKIHGKKFKKRMNMHTKRSDTGTLESKMFRKKEMQD